MSRTTRSTALVVSGLLAAVTVSTVAPGAGTAQSAAQSGELTALSYNVAGLPEPLSGSEPDTNTPLISPLLNAYDLVLVQEDWADPVPPNPVFDLHHDDLISAVDHPFQSDPAPQPLGADPRRPEALLADGLNRLSRVPFGPVTRLMWTDCFGGIDTSDGGAGDCLAQKGFSVARTELAPGVEADVYNLHGEAGGTDLDAQYSAADFVQLAAFVQTHSAGRAVILGGDTNLHSDEPGDGAVWTQFLAETGLTDVCQVVDCGSDDHRIDKFAFRNGGEVTISPTSHQFEVDRFRRDDGEPLSDHDALAVTFAWTGPAAPTPTTNPVSPTSAVPVAPVAPAGQDQTPAASPATPTAGSPRYTG